MQLWIPALKKNPLPFILHISLFLFLWGGQADVENRKKRDQSRLSDLILLLLMTKKPKTNCPLIFKLNSYQNILEIIKYNSLK